MLLKVVPKHAVIGPRAPHISCKCTRISDCYILSCSRRCYICRFRVYDVNAFAAWRSAVVDELNLSLSVGYAHLIFLIDGDH